MYYDEKTIYFYMNNELQLCFKIFLQKKVLKIGHGDLTPTCALI